MYIQGYITTITYCDYFHHCSKKAVLPAILCLYSELFLSPQPSVSCMPVPLPTGVHWYCSSSRYFMFL